MTELSKKELRLATNLEAYNALLKTLKDWQDAVIGMSIEGKFMRIIDSIERNLKEILFQEKCNCVGLPARYSDCPGLKAPRTYEDTIPGKIYRIMHSMFFADRTTVERADVEFMSTFISVNRVSEWWMWRPTEEQITSLQKEAQKQLDKINSV